MIAESLNKRPHTVFEKLHHKREIAGFLSARCSAPRLSCESAMTGTCSFFANSLRARENSETSRWLLSHLRDLSCRNNVLVIRLKRRIRCTSLNSRLDQASFSHKSC